MKRQQEDDHCHEGIRDLKTALRRACPHHAQPPRAHLHPGDTDERDDGPGPRSLEFTYDVSDRLDTFTDADGGVWHFGWTGDLLTEVRRPEAGATGPAVVNVFDTLGRVESQTDEEDRETTFDYDTPFAGTTRVTLPSGLVRDDVYVGGVLVAQTIGVGTAEAYTTSWTRDPATFAHTS